MKNRGMGKFEKCDITSLCQTIADQNGLIFEIGGDSGEGYYLKFGISNDSSYEVEYVDIDPMQKNIDFLLAIAKIYRAVRNLIVKRADIVSNGIKEFADNN